MNNSETFTVSESLKGFSVYCRIHGGYVNGNVLTYPAFFFFSFFFFFGGCTQMCPGLLCSPSSRKLISAGSDPGSCSCPPSSPIICHHVGRCSLTCGLQMAILCSTASTGATVPPAQNNCHDLPHDTFILMGLIHQNHHVRGSARTKGFSVLLHRRGSALRAQRHTLEESVWGVAKKASREHLMVDEISTYTGSSYKNILTTWDIHLSRTVYLLLLLKLITIIELAVM